MSAFLDPCWLVDIPIYWYLLKIHLVILEDITNRTPLYNFKSPSKPSRTLKSPQTNSSNQEKPRKSKYKSIQNLQITDQKLPKSHHHTAPAAPGLQESAMVAVSRAFHAPSRGDARRISGSGGGGPTCRTSKWPSFVQTKTQSATLVIWKHDVLGHVRVAFKVF